MLGGYTDIPWGKYDYFVLTNTIIRRKGLTLECKCWAGTRISLGVNMINKVLKNTIIRRKGLTLECKCSEDKWMSPGVNMICID